MDELWQRYRTFWTPILYGVGALIVGLIVVHILTDDPDVGRNTNTTLSNGIKSRTAPTPAQIASLKRNIGSESDEGLVKRTRDWAKRLDQRHGEEEDLFRAAIAQALKAAILRGSAPGDASAFDGDTAAAAQAKQRADALLEERLNLLKTLDPNVGFSRLQADVVQELAIRANRADVDVGAEEFGLSAITSVDRADLPRRLLNLALIAQVVDVAIRAQVRSIDTVSISAPEVGMQVLGADAFLSEWPVQVDMTGDPQSLKAVLQMLTDPARPTALGSCTWKQTGKKDGLVKAQMKVYSIRVLPTAHLDLESEGE